MNALQYGRAALPDLRQAGDLCLRGNGTLIF